MIIEPNRDRYDVIFQSYEEMSKEIYVLGDFMKYRKFEIYVKDIYGYECVAADFCNTILVDRLHGDAVAKVLSDNQIAFRYFS